MRWAGGGGVHRESSWGKPEGERLLGRPRRGWKDNIKMKTLFRSEFRNVLGNLEGILSDYTQSNTTRGIHVYLLLLSLDLGG
jgi:hypothetical protein